jgi:hypothetical protein
MSRILTGRVLLGIQWILLILSEESMGQRWP